MSSSPQEETADGIARPADEAERAFPIVSRELSSEPGAEWRRAPGLHVIRESNESNLELFNAIREQTFAQIASMERDRIVQRLLAGKTARWRRNEWPFEWGSVPVGYKVDPETLRLVVDEAKEQQDD